MDSRAFRGRSVEAVRRLEPGHRTEPPWRPDAQRRAEGTIRRPTLAVDLGTSGCHAILVLPERDVLIEDPDLGQPVWPSAVAHDGAGPRIGGSAESYLRVHPQCGRNRLKQLLGENTLVRLGDNGYHPIDMIGWLFEGIRIEAERVGGTEVTRAVLTVPFGFGTSDPRRDILLQAAAAAGFTTVELVSEPLATAGASLAGGSLNPGDIALVCDLGASGFRGTLVSLIKGGVTELLGHQDIPECGGLEIDRMIMNELLSRAGRTWADLMRQPEDPAQRMRAVRARVDLEDRARRMKHQLSSHESAIELIGPDEVPVELTSRELTSLMAPVVISCADAFRSVLHSAGVRPGELAAVVLAGGGSRMPLVSDVLADTFHRPVRLTVDGTRAAVEGAARFARGVERRHVRARVATDRETPLRWDIPGGTASELQWMLAPGTRFGAPEPLAVVRLPDGALWELRSGRAGTLIRTHVQDGAQIASGDWLVTVELDVRPFR